ncbi:STAS domain-containing protein [Streptomyces racemochromogenes]|uniref:STAS domain-containing protein n=1 Tax=Streptomyces racemochromogenes TaxID=67353 RepID=A0ABW7PLE2_9ACTN
MIEILSAHVSLDTPAAAPGFAVCRIFGDVDIESRSDLRDAFARAVARATTGVLVDCTHLAFADSTLLNALVQLRRATRARHLSLALIAPPRQLRHLLDLTGTAGLLPAHVTLTEALAATAGLPGGP